MTEHVVLGFSGGERQAAYRSRISAEIERLRAMVGSDEEAATSIGVRVAARHEIDRLRGLVAQQMAELKRLRRARNIRASQ